MDDFSNECVFRIQHFIALLCEGRGFEPRHEHITTGLAQLVRAPVLCAGGQRFKSSILYSSRCSSVGRAWDCSCYNIPGVPGSNPGGEIRAPTAMLIFLRCYENVFYWSHGAIG